MSADDIVFFDPLSESFLPPAQCSIKLFSRKPASVYQVSDRELRCRPKSMFSSPHVFSYPKGRRPPEDNPRRTRHLNSASHPRVSSRLLPTENCKRPSAGSSSAYQEAAVGGADESDLPARRRTRPTRVSRNRAPARVLAIKQDLSARRDTAHSTPMRKTGCGTRRPSTGAAVARSTAVPGSIPRTQCWTSRPVAIPPKSTSSSGTLSQSTSRSSE